MRQPRFNPQLDFWYSFLLEAESINPGTIVRLEGLGELKKFIDLIKNGTRMLVA
jgi:hypothetical protein